MGKGEIAGYDQFFLFPQYFQKACFPGASKGVIVWEWVKPIPKYCMFGMKGFYISASGAIQGYHGPLVFIKRL